MERQIHDNGQRWHEGISEKLWKYMNTFESENEIEKYIYLLERERKTMSLKREEMPEYNKWKVKIY